MTTAAKTTIVGDICEISKRLDGKVEFNDIFFSQILVCDHGEGCNNLIPIKSMYGVYFYTTVSSLERSCNLSSEPMEIYVCYDKSYRVFRISK